jgi:hypothetical protein
MSSISNTTGHAAQSVRDAASHARESVLEFGTQLLEVLGRMREAEGQGVDRLLQRLGLQRRGGVTQPIAFFAAGAVLGASAALLFAPTSGSELRRNIAGFWSTKVDKVASLVKPVLRSVEKDLGDGEPAKTNDNGVHA